MSDRRRAAGIGRQRAVLARLTGCQQCRRSTGFGMETKFGRGCAHCVMRSMEQAPQAKLGVVLAFLIAVRRVVERRRRQRRCSAYRLAGMLRLVQRPSQQQAQHRQGEQPALDR